MQERPQSIQYIMNDVSDHSVKEHDFSHEDYASLLKQYASTGEYSALQTLIMLHADYLEGVKSHLELNPSRNVFPTGIAIVRDATGVLKRLCEPNHPLLEIDNMLLRTLTTMRAVYHVLQVKKMENTALGERFTSLQASLKKELDILIKDVIRFQHEHKPDSKIDSSAMEKIEQLEIKFNLILRRTLEGAGLCTGVKSDSEHENLLAHYRDLASTLDNAPSLMTTQRYGEFIHREIAHPITKKTPQQIEQLKVMCDGERAGLNFHSAQIPAMREANACFYNLIIHDDRRLPAQTRKTIGPTVKNGYVVCSQLEVYLPPKRDEPTAPHQLTPIAQLWTARCGAPVYIGKGESEESRLAYTAENFTQLQEHVQRIRYRSQEHRASKDVQLHMLLLLTNTFLQGQSTMLAGTKKVKERFNSAGTFPTICWSNVPTNFEGMARPIELDPIFERESRFADIAAPSTGLDIGAKSDRVKKGADLVRIAAINSDLTTVIMCASGQDRTGTIQEIATEYWLKDMLNKFGLDLPLEKIQEIRTQGFFNAYLASLSAPGSIGMKKDSRPDAFFSPEACAYFYRDSADTNKSVPLVNPKEALMLAYNYLSDLLKSPSATAVEAYEAFLNWLEKALVYQQSKSESKIPTVFLTLAKLAHKGTNAMPREEVNKILIELQKNVDTQDWATSEAQIHSKKEQYDVKARGTVFTQLEGLISHLRMRFPETELSPDRASLDDRPGRAPQV